MIIYVSVFFSLPVGAELPIYYTHKQGMYHEMSYPEFTASVI